MKLPLRGWPKDVLDDLEDCISRIVDAKKVEMFYIGRTTDVRDTIHRHAPDRIITLYETDSVDNAIVVEGNLIGSFYDDDKCDNKNDHGGGGVSVEFVNFVYLALWYS